MEIWNHWDAIKYTQEKITKVDLNNIVNKSQEKNIIYIYIYIYT